MWKEKINNEWEDKEGNKKKQRIQECCFTTLKTQERNSRIDNKLHIVQVKYLCRKRIIRRRVASV